MLKTFFFFLKSLSVDKVQSMLGLLQGSFLLIFFCEWMVLFFLHDSRCLLKTGHFENFNVTTLEIIFFNLFTVCFVTTPFVCFSGNFSKLFL